MKHMNVVFITLGRIRDISEPGIYTDLMRKFRDEGHAVYVVVPFERGFGLETSLKEVDGVHLLGVKTWNVQQTSIIEKGIGTILLETQFKKAVRKYLSDISFDLILASTPPITFTGIIKYLKSRNPEAVSYLLLKDIFPQNAVDLGMFSKGSLFYKYFRRKERRMYRLSDHIGCMSPANVRFLLKDNPELHEEKIEIAPNSITIIEAKREEGCRVVVRQKYHLPVDKPIFIYGGNLGKPQGIDYVIACMDANKNRTDCHFLIVGGGTEYGKIENWYNKNCPQSVSVLSSLSQEEYDFLVASCDVGLIFLDHRFLVPNYPSRLLSYLRNGMPIIAATDVHSDVGVLAEQNGYGYWCESVRPEDFTACVDRFMEAPETISVMGERGCRFLLDNYQTKHTYAKIMAHIK